MQRKQTPWLVLQALKGSAFVFKTLACLVDRQEGRTARYLDKCGRHAFVLFDPETASLADYAESFRETRIALESADMGSKGKVIFFHHGFYMLQNMASVLILIAEKSVKPETSVLLFRRSSFPEIEQWWKSYAVAMKINLTIVHADELLMIQTAKTLLKSHDVVLCAPDFFFRAEKSFPDSLRDYSQVTKLFMKMAKSTNSDVLYVNCNKASGPTEQSSVMSKLDGYDPGDIEDLFSQELANNPEGWAYYPDHYHAMAELREINRRAADALADNDQ